MNDDVGYVLNSKYRMRAMMSLDGKAKFPSEIALDAEIFQNHISNTLSQLKKRGLVECINPEAKRGRLYRLTARGEEVCEKLRIS